jgi:hypothetical protein
LRPWRSLCSSQAPSERERRMMGHKLLKMRLFSFFHSLGSATPNQSKSCFPFAPRRQRSR